MNLEDIQSSIDGYTGTIELSPKAIETFERITPHLQTLDTYIGTREPPEQSATVSITETPKSTAQISLKEHFKGALAATEPLENKVTFPPSSPPASAAAPGGYAA